MKKSTSFIISGIIFATVLVLGYFLFPGDRSQKDAADTKTENKAEAKIIPQEYGTVKDLSYEGAKLTDGKATVSGTRVTLMPELSVAGDLNNDKKNDLAIVSYEDEDQGESFRNLAIYLSNGETYQYAGKIFLGDRVRVREVMIGEDGTISVNMYTHRPDDFLEAPTHFVQEKYKTVNGETVELGRTDLPAENAGKAN